MDRSLPSPPMEGSKHPSMPKRTSTTSSSKSSSKSIHRAPKRSPTSHSHSHSPTHEHAPGSPHAHAGSLDSKHKRVWKACSRCRLKKSKCDGEFPCKRCKDDGLVCIAGVRKKVEYKQLPKGYAEVLESTQLALVATIHKLYGMVRNGQEWDLGEPEFNDKGLPIVHNIATKLGCIRPNADIDLPPHSVFPEDEGGLATLAAELEVQQKEREIHMGDHKSEPDTYQQAERAGSSELDHSDFEQDYRKAFLGGQSLQTASPSSLASYSDLESNSFAPEMDPSMLFSVQSSSAPNTYPVWNMGRPASMDISPQYLTSMDMDMADVMLNQGLVESEFGTIKPHMLSCPNPEVMMGVGDPMIYSGYNTQGQA